MKRTLLTLVLAAMVVPSVFAYIAPKTKHPEVVYNKIKLHCTLLPKIGQLDASDSDNASRSRWSVGTEGLDRNYATFSKYKEYLGPLGVGYARLQSGWARCEQKKGVYDFKWLDEAVDGIIAQGVKPWLSLSYGNPLYCGGGISLKSAIWTDEPTMKAWRNYVRATVRHYGDRVTTYEIWNEPDGQKANTPAILAELIINTAEVIRKENPKATILALGLASPNISFVKGVLDILKERNKLHLIDKVSFHAYYPNPDNATTSIIAFSNTVRSYSNDLDVVQGESGCPSAYEFGSAMKYNEWSEYKQAKWDLRRMANDFAMNIPSSIFSLVDLQYPYMQQSFGLVRVNLMHEPQYKRPSYYAVQHLTRLLHDGIQPVEVKCQAFTNSEIKCVGLANKSGEKVGVMLWKSDLVPTDNLNKENVSVTLVDFAVEDLVYVEPITGYVHDLSSVITRGANEVDIAEGANGAGNLRCAGLPLWDAPIILIKKSEIKLQ